MNKPIVKKIANNILLEEVRRKIQLGSTATFVVRGWSMRPFLEHGRDKVLLGPVPASGPQVGDVALVLADDGRYILHRIVALDPDGQGCTLWGDGNIEGREHAAIGQVIGIARGFYRPRGLRGQEIYFSSTGKAWQHYSRWWMQHSPTQRLWWLRTYRLLLRFGIISSAK